MIIAIINVIFFAIIVTIGIIVMIIKVTVIMT